MKKKKLNFTSIVLISMVLGIIVGNFMTRCPEIAAKYIYPIGEVYINLLKLLVVPVVLISIINGVVSLGDIKKIGTVGLTTILFFLATTILATTFGLISANIFKPLFPTFDLGGLTYEAVQTNFLDVLLGIFPSNWLTPLIESDMLGVIFIAVLTGFGILLAGENGKKVGEFFNSFNDVILHMMRLIIGLTPIGVFCLMISTIAQNGLSFVPTLGIVLLAAYVTYIVFMIVVYGLSVKLIGKMSPIYFFKKVAFVMTMAFSTASSNATLPSTIKIARDIGCDENITSFVAPLGCTIHMDGSAIYIGIITVFIAKCYGVNLTLIDLLTVVVMSIFASIGTAGVPGAAMIMTTMVLQSLGLPIEGIALIAGIDKLLDMGRTCLNVTGDVVASLVVTKILKK